MNFNSNKWFPFLSIRKKLIITFTPLSFVPLSVIGIISISHTIKLMREIAYQNLQHDITIIKERDGKFLFNIKLNLEFLSNSPIFERYIQEMGTRVESQNSETTSLLHPFRKPSDKILSFLQVKFLPY